MNPTPAKILVSAADNSVWIRIIGRANFVTSVDFKAALTGLAQGGCARFALDLTECVLMDSTFLGVLAGFALRMNELNSHSPDHVVELLNPNARVSELLENLGVLHLFRIVTGPAYEPMADTVEALASEKPDSETLTRTSLEAHETLMGIDPENVPKFKDVTKFLAEDLKRFKPNA